jgi:hypothetical protein
MQVVSEVRKRTVYVQRFFFLAVLKGCWAGVHEPYLVEVLKRLRL